MIEPTPNVYRACVSRDITALFRAVDGSGVSAGIYLVEAGRCVAGILQRTEQSTWYISGNETEACSVFTTALSRPGGRRGSGSGE